MFFELTISDDLRKLKASFEQRIARSRSEESRKKACLEFLPKLIACCMNREECESVFRSCLRLGLDNESIILVFAALLSFAKTINDFQGAFMWRPDGCLKSPLLQDHLCRFRSLIELEIGEAVTFRDHDQIWMNYIGMAYDRGHPRILPFLESWLRTAKTEEEKKRAMDRFPQYVQALLF